MSGLFLDRLDWGDADVDAYLERIGQAGPVAADLATLRGFHRLHPAAIPFENIDVRLGQPVDLQASTVDRKLLHRKRGGYCFEHNTLLLRVLKAIGFRAEPLIGRSRWRRPETEIVARTHMGLRVTIGDTDWLVDVGFGACMLTSPLRMDTGAVQETGHEPARLIHRGTEIRLEMLLGGAWQPLCDYVLAAAEGADVQSANWLIANHPASSFRHHLILSRTTDTTRYVLVDNKLTMRTATGDHSQHLLDPAGLEAALTEYFRLEIEEEWREAGLLGQLAPAP